MPIIHFQTNVSRDKLSDGFEGRAAKFTSQQLGAPAKAVVVMINPCSIFRMGSDEPCLLIKLECVDAFNDQENNRKYSKEFIDFAAAEFKVEPQRITLLMENQCMWEIGIPDGRLLGDRMKAMKGGK